MLWADTSGLVLGFGTKGTGPQGREQSHPRKKKSTRGPAERKRLGVPLLFLRGRALLLKYFVIITFPAGISAKH